jgi:hypothetical protein
MDRLPAMRCRIEIHTVGIQPGKYSLKRFVCFIFLPGRIGSLAMKKKPLFIEELMIWLNGRFTLTDEEKNWILLVLIICWVGLAGRYFYLKNQPPPAATMIKDK